MAIMIYKLIKYYIHILHIFIGNDL